MQHSVMRQVFTPDTLPAVREAAQMDAQQHFGPDVPVYLNAEAIQFIDQSNLNYTSTWTDVQKEALPPDFQVGPATATTKGSKSPLSAGEAAAKAKADAEAKANHEADLKAQSANQSHDKK